MNADDAVQRLYGVGSRSGEEERGARSEERRHSSWMCGCDWRGEGDKRRHPLPLATWLLLLHGSLLLRSLLLRSSLVPCPVVEGVFAVAPGAGITQIVVSLSDVREADQWDALRVQSRVHSPLSNQLRRSGENVP